MVGHNLNHISNEYSCMTNEEHQRIVQAGIKMLNIPNKPLADTEELLRKAKAKLAVVRNFAQTIDNEIRVAGKEHDKKVLFQQLCSSYLDQFVQFNKDELLIILAFLLSELTLKEIV